MTYYFIDDFNNICRQKEGIDKDFAEVIDLVDLIDDINKLHDENKELKKLNSNIQKSIDYQDETIKEQCNKLDWASECGVRWEDEYNKWIGNLRTEK